jgi:copper homeostasis protein
MKPKPLLEISVETLGAAQAAERAGADRIELCGDLSVGGITPSVALLSAVREQIHLPIFSMVRPRAGDFVYSATEFDSMKADIATAKSLGMNGVVLGILTNDLHVDIERTRRLVELADPLPVTFHRAFDDCRDPFQSLEDVIATGAARLLTSGAAPSAAEGTAVLAELVARAQDRLVILPGAGINPSNIVDIAKKIRATEFHSGLSSSLPRPYPNYAMFESEIRKLVDALSNLHKNRASDISNALRKTLR